jgi:hypothetical protein
MYIYIYMRLEEGGSRFGRVRLSGRDDGGSEILSELFGAELGLSGGLLFDAEAVHDGIT